MSHYVTPEMFQILYNFFGDLTISLPFATLLVLLVFVSVLGIDTQRPVPRWTKMSESYRLMLLVSGGFLLIPFCAYLGGLLVTGSFPIKYYMIAIIGLILALPLMLSALSSSRELAGLCLFVAMAGNGLLVRGSRRHHDDFVRTAAFIPQLAEMLRCDSRLQHPDIVVPSPLPFPAVLRIDQIGSGE